MVSPCTRDFCSDINNLEIGDRAVCLLTLTVTVEHVDAHGVVDVVCRDVLPGDMTQMGILCTCVYLDPEGVIRAVHDDVAERNVLHTGIRMHGTDAQTMSMADVGVCHCDIVSVHCHVIVTVSIWQ